MYQIILSALGGELEAIEHVLLEFGAIAITLQDAADQPLLEPAPGEHPLWSSMTITSLFSTPIDVDALRATLGKALSEDRGFQLNLERVADKDWTQAWKAGFKPMRFGRRLWIVPSWQSFGEANAVVVILDPGLAFGTGTHPSTALCLRWLDANPPEAANLVDYGCGSGVLSIAALKLGAQHVWAVDIDSQALLATRENAQKNTITPDCVEIAHPDRLPNLQADLLIANILSVTLIELSQRIASTVKPAGTLVLSGILADQAETVMNAYANHFEMRSVLSEDGWVLLEGQRNSS